MVKSTSELVTHTTNRATQDLMRSVEPDINYARRLAVHQRILFRLTELTLEDLLSVRAVPEMILRGGAQTRDNVSEGWGVGR